MQDLADWLDKLGMSEFIGHRPNSGVVEPAFETDSPQCSEAMRYVRDDRQHLASIPECNPDIFEVLIGEIAKHHLS
jgi:hypothetical protein